MKKLNYQVDGMNCGSCVGKIENHFKNMDGIDSLTVSLENKNVLIEGSDELSGMSLKKEFEELGFQVTGMKKDS